VGLRLAWKEAKRKPEFAENAIPAQQGKGKREKKSKIARNSRQLSSFPQSL
jgi:hypothetical protein